MRPGTSPSMIPAYYFDEEQLGLLLKAHGGAFLQNPPFPHVVIDNLLPPEVLRRLIGEFPGPDDIPWNNWGAGRTGVQAATGTKLGLSEEAYFPPFIRHFLAQLNSATFIRFIERLTGMSGLVTDPTYSGCGLHSTGSGGRLMIHTDANRHPHSSAGLHQILNLIVYLNDDWQEDWGGHLELWTADRRRHTRIAPKANRAVLFFTGSRSFHGHPEPLACPPERRRNSLAVYYYTYNRMQDEEYDGMQYAVRWVPTTAGDHAAARVLARNGLARLATMAGRTIEISATALRMPLEPHWGDRLLVTLLDGQGLDSVACEALPAAPFDADACGSLRAFATVTSLRAADTGAQEVLAFIAEDGAVHLAKDGETPIYFFGYISAFLRCLDSGDRRVPTDHVDP